MKGSRTVNTQKLMKKLLALPVLETMEGKRAVELSRVLEAVRASSIAGKHCATCKHNGLCLPDNYFGILATCCKRHTINNPEAGCRDYEELI